MLVGVDLLAVGAGDDRRLRAVDARPRGDRRRAEGLLIVEHQALEAIAVARRRATGVAHLHVRAITEVDDPTHEVLLIEIAALVIDERELAPREEADHVAVPARDLVSLGSMHELADGSGIRVVLDHAPVVIDLAPQAAVVDVRIAIRGRDRLDRLDRRQPVEQAAIDGRRGQLARPIEELQALDLGTLGVVADDV